MPSTFWVHCSSKQIGKPPVLSRPGKILRGYGAFTSANFKNSPGIRPSAKNSRGSSRPIILRLNRGTPRRKCRNPLFRLTRRLPGTSKLHEGKTAFVYTFSGNCLAPPVGQACTNKANEQSCPSQPRGNSAGGQKLAPTKDGGRTLSGSAFCQT